MLKYRDVLLFLKHSLVCVAYVYCEVGCSDTYTWVEHPVCISSVRQAALQHSCDLNNRMYNVSQRCTIIHRYRCGRHQ